MSERTGFRGYILLTEVGVKKAMAIAMWDTEDEMNASAHVARAMVGELKDLLKAPPKTEGFAARFYVTP
jgi:hypothetical protein